MNAISSGLLKYMYMAIVAVLIDKLSNKKALFSIQFLLLARQALNKHAR